MSLSVILFSYLIYRWNANIAYWLEIQILYVPHITKIYLTIIIFFSIIYRGLFVPLKNDDQHQWKIIFGARRFYAAWIANLSEIPAIIVTKNLDSEEEKLLFILESEVERKITKKEKKEIMNDMKKLKKNKNKRNKVRTYEINE